MKWLDLMGALMLRDTTDKPKSVDRLVQLANQHLGWFKTLSDREQRHQITRKLNKKVIMGTAWRHRFVFEGDKRGIAPGREKDFLKNEVGFGVVAATRSINLTTWSPPDKAGTLFPDTHPKSGYSMLHVVGHLGWGSIGTRHSGATSRRRGRSGCPTRTLSRSCAESTAGTGAGTTTTGSSPI
jgi:hypothetical protein